MALGEVARGVLIRTFVCADCDNPSMAETSLLLATEVRLHIHPYPHSHIPTFTHTHIHPYPHSHIPTITHTHIHTYPQSHILTYTCSQSHIPTYGHTRNLAFFGMNYICRVLLLVSFHAVLGEYEIAVSVCSSRGASSENVLQTALFQS